MTAILSRPQCYADNTGHIKTTLSIIRYTYVLHVINDSCLTKKGRMNMSTIRHSGTTKVQAVQKIPTIKRAISINSSPPSAAYMRQWIRTALVNNGLSPIRHQAIIWTNTALLSIGPLGINFSEILIIIQDFSFMKMHLQISSVKWQPFWPGGDESTHVNQPIWIMSSDHKKKSQRNYNMKSFTSINWLHQPIWVTEKPV